MLALGPHDGRMVSGLTKRGWRRVLVFAACGFVGGLLGGVIGNATAGHPAWDRTALELGVWMAVGFGGIEFVRVLLRQRRTRREPPR